MKAPNSHALILAITHYYAGLVYRASDARWFEPQSVAAYARFADCGIRAKAERMVLGHIEWALSVLERAGCAEVGALTLEEEGSDA